jgi:hypothetical protein
MYFLISTYSNFLTISLKENGKLTEKSIQLDATVLNDSEIKNITEFTKILFNNLYDLKGGNYKNIPIVFLMDPLKNHFRFIKSQKELNFDNQTSQIFTELKIEGNDYYFGVHKISPFVSQFIATKKSEIDTYVSVANELECDLLGVFSYLPMIARHAAHSGNLILITSYLGNIVIALSEMGGIYFNNKYGSFKDVGSVKEMVENLRIFKSSTQNNKIISFNFENPEASIKLGIGELPIENEFGYKNPIHNLADKSLNEDFINSSYNLVNCYFEKAKERKKPSKVVVGFFTALFMAGACTFCYDKFVDNTFYSNLYDNVLGESVASIDEPVPAAPAPLLNSLPEVISIPQSSSLSTSNLVTSPADSTKTVTDPSKSIDDPLKTPHSNSSDFKRETFKVSVINSTGVTGLAKRNSDMLIVMGYKNVQTGTSNDPVVGTIVKIKSSLSQYKDQIYKDLLTFKDIKIQETLPETSPLDIVIVLGK